MLQLVKKIIKFFIPNRFSLPANERYNRFIKIRDSIAGKSFFLFFRKDSFMERVILENGLYGDWEKESLKIWAHLAKNAQVIIDIGANTGIFSMLAQNNNPAGKVIAIEPVDINFQVLVKNIQRNKFSVIAEQVALSDIAGTAKMFMLKDRLNYMTSVNDDRYANAPHVKGDYEVVEIEVPTATFHDIVVKYSLPKVDLVKIDVEGHEVPVIKNMLETIKKDRPVILLEVIGDNNAEALNEIFKPLNYKFISIDEQEISYVVEKVWDNQHHNFLFCHEETIIDLRNKKLVK